MGVAALHFADEDLWGTETKCLSQGPMAIRCRARVRAESGTCPPVLFLLLVLTAADRAQHLQLQAHLLVGTGQLAAVGFPELLPGFLNPNSRV